MQSEEKFCVTAAFDKILVLLRFIWKSEEIMPNKSIQTWYDIRIMKGKIETKSKQNLQATTKYDAEGGTSFFREWEVHKNIY